MSSLLLIAGYAYYARNGVQKAKTDAFQHRSSLSPVAGAGFGELKKTHCLVPEYPPLDFFLSFEFLKIIITVLSMHYMDQLIPPGSIAITSALRGITDVFQILQPGMVRVESRGQILKDVFRAIIERRVCWIEYQRGKAGKKSRFEFNPYSLLFHAGAIYVIGFQPYYKNWLYLAIQRIRGVSPTDEVFERDPAYNLQDFLKDNFGIWYEEPVDVVIRFDKVVANSIEERTWHHSQRILHPDNGDIELKMHVGPSEELVAWILRWGTFAEVLEPESLKQRVKKIFEDGMKMYKDKKSFNR